MAPFRDRHLAVFFIVLMYVLIGALLAGLIGAVLAGGGLGGTLAAVAGGLLGAAFAAWQIRRTPAAERADDNTS
ncbi:hypothetical protein V2W30_00590 [Streptomyces sp. Q6]|uniref:Uncharacterized protein n=1 Tax=Streptomyces citrinus TaxID=3118173 RepID=A0ACD5A4B1_9ACTN